MRHQFRMFDLPDDITEQELMRVICAVVTPKCVWIASKNDIAPRWAFVEFRSNDDMLLAHAGLHGTYAILLGI